MSTANPLNHPDEWEDDLLRRYPDPNLESNTGDGFVATDPDKKKEQFRDYDAEARASVKEFYRLNHQHQTFDFVQQKRAEYLPLTKCRMGIWQAMEFLNNLVDDSDPDTDATQIEHLLQTAESVRADGHPRWLILTGLIHDLGKILCLWDEPQWAVVGDTFPVGCAYSQKIVFHEYFQDNPDSNNAQYQSKFGIYEPNTGLQNVTMSWGHDEYLYHVVKDYLPEEALYPIRYHSFYPAHKENDYDYLFSDHDREMFKWVREFNQYDLYSKSDERPSVEKLKPFYEELIDEFFPAELAW